MLYDVNVSIFIVFYKLTKYLHNCKFVTTRIHLLCKQNCCCKVKKLIRIKSTVYFELKIFYI